MPIITEGDTSYFTEAEFQARYPDLASAYTDEQIEHARDLAENAYEHAIGYALVPRTTTETSVGVTSGTLQLPHRFVREVTAATDRDGTEVTISSPVYDGSGWVDMAAGWGAGHPLSVTYTHGKDAPDPLDVNAVMILARHYLIGSNSAVDDRALGIGIPESGIVDLSIWPREVNRAIELRRIPSIA